jgi:hypothetical protein
LRLFAPLRVTQVKKFDLALLSWSL